MEQSIVKLRFVELMGGWPAGCSDGWGIRVVGRAPLRWPDRVVALEG